MSQEVTTGRITEWREDGSVVICAVLPNIEKAIRRKYDKVQIGFDDGRHISVEQRRKVYALIGEIAEYVGEHPEEMKKTMKMDFVLNRMQSMTRKMFSLANCSMELATDFITYLVDFIIENDIPTTVPLIDNCEDIGKYVYACLMHKKCCVCGRKADLHHHTKKVGMGRDREEINHLGFEVLPLCREHHNEAHTQGGEEFLDKYHIQTVKVDKEIASKYNLKVVG